MTARTLGFSLGSAFEVDGGASDLADLLADVQDPLATSFLPATMFIVPQFYMTRNERRVDVCGTVDENSSEYAEGYRYYSSEGEFFLADGRCDHNSQNPCDLMHVIEQAALAQTAKPVAPYLWVHPQHWEVKTWFHPLGTGKRDVKVGTHYRNRMGLIIELTGSSGYEGSNQTFFTDKEGRYYTVTGTVRDQSPSMFDLVAEVRHWEMFVEHDWTTDRGIAVKKKELPIPELFDPTGRHRKERMAEFFELMARVNALADELDIELGFHMKTSDHLLG